MINLLHNTTNQPSRFKTEKWVEINDRLYGSYSTGSQIKFKASMISLILCEYKDAYILAKRTITVSNKGKASAPKNRAKKVMFKNYAPFIDCMSEIQNKEIDHADTDVVMPIYILIKYKDNCSKSSGSSWKYYWDEPFTNDTGVIIDVHDDPNSASFKYKQKIPGQTRNNGTKDVQIMIPFRTLEMLLINCEFFFLKLVWRMYYSSQLMDYGNEKPKFAITDSKLDVPFVTLSA